MGVPGGGGLAVPWHSPLLSRAIAAPQLGLGTGSTVRMPHGPRPLPCLSQRPPTLLSFHSPAQTAPSPGREVPPSTAGPTLSAEALRLGNSGTFTPLPSGDARTRRLRGSSTASSSEDASSRAGRGSAGGHGDSVTVRPPAEDRHPPAAPALLPAPALTSGVAEDPAVPLGGGGGAQGGCAVRALAAQAGLAAVHAAVQHRRVLRDGDRHRQHRQPQDGSQPALGAPEHPQPVRPQTPQQHWGPRIHRLPLRGGPA